MNYNGELKTIDSQEKAYLLGWIYGDGYCGCWNKKYKLSIATIDTDILVFTALQKYFPFLRLKRIKSKSNMIYLESYSKDLCLDLENIGMISSKTVNDKLGKFHFPKLDECLIPHFIRGVFDADGSAYLPTRKKSRNNLHIEFSLATKNFLYSIKSILDKYDIRFSWYERYKKAGNGKYYYSYTLLSSNKEVSLQFADFIYKDASIYLERKFNKCYNSFSFKESNYKIFGSCPYCNSTDIQRKGIRGNKQRLKCNNCHKGFSKQLPK